MEKKLKRFCLFLGDNYYPGGGWTDFSGSFNTVEQAKVAADTCHGDWAQIVDTWQLEVILESHDRPNPQGGRYCLTLYPWKWETPRKD